MAPPCVHAQLDGASIEPGALGVLAMNYRPLGRSIALSLAALLAVAGTAAADSARADGDAAAGIQGIATLGQVGPGELRTVSVPFVLTCTGSSHVDVGQTVTLGIDSRTASEDGEIVEVSDGTLGPVVEGWPADGAPCGSPVPTSMVGTPSIVTLRTPTVPGPHTYSLRYHRAISPFGVDDPTAVGGLTTIVIAMVVNTAPVLTLPTAATAGAVEADATGGWTADWSGLGATDAEDDPDPAAGCAPAAGTVLSLGTTTVTCAVADAGGLSASASFDISVVDTTAPTLTGVPVNQALTTGDPRGTTINYTPPGATDVADGAPTVSCLPASGDPVGLGSTVVECTATDASGNSSQASFSVSVTYVAPHVASATWGEPVAGFEAAFSANRGRTIPVKVELSWDGVRRTTGMALLTVTPCGGGSPVTSPLTYSGGRWNAALETVALVGACHDVVASIDGLDAGAFRLELRGAELAKAGTANTDVAGTLTPMKPKEGKPARSADAKPAKSDKAKG